MKRLITTLLLAVTLTSFAMADLFQAGKPSFEIKTKYFTILFQEEARADALYLSLFADTTYDEIAKLMGTETHLRIPVIITSGHESINGYSTSMPYNKIVLYQAPTELDSELGGFDNSIKQLFYHELVHQVSLDIKSPFWRFFQTMLGDPISPNNSVMIPSNFIEGVTVSLESLGGYGRVNDPFAAHILFQDAIEGKFRTYDQSQGADERYPYGSIFYLYGGYFSKMLQERSGMQAYSDFFKKTGEGNIFTGVPGAFLSSFGLSIDDAWKLFKSKYTDQFPVSKKTKTIDNNLSYYTALSANDDIIYYVDAGKKTIFSYDSKNNTTKPVLFYGNAINHLSISHDNTKLLISETYPDNGFDKVRIREYDLIEQAWTNRVILHAREAAYAENDIIAIKVNGYKTDLVLYSGTQEKVLLSGTYTLSFADPCTLDASYFAFLLKDAGNVKIARMNRATLAIDILDSTIALIKPRFLSSQNGSLNFAYVSDFSLYKLGSLKNNELKIQTENLSGGINMPVQTASGNYFYNARFSSGMRICEYLQDEIDLTLQTTSFSWKPFIESSKTTEESVFAKENTKAMNPFNFLTKPFRLPVVAGSIENAILYDYPYEIQYGISLNFQDETEANSIAVSLASSTGTPFANVILSWKNTSLPIDITLVTFDTYSHIYESDPLGQRDTGFVVQAQKAFDLSYRDQLTFSLGASWQLASLRRNISEHPYELPYEYQSLTAALNGGFSNIRSNTIYPMLKSGFLIDAGINSGIKSTASETFYYTMASASGGFSLPIFFTCLKVNAYGVYGTENVFFSPTGALVHGNSFYTYEQTSYPAFMEYVALSKNQEQKQWYAYGDTIFDFVDLPLEFSVPFTPIYLNRAKLSAGARASLFNSEILNSTYGKLTVMASPLIGSFSRAHLSFYVEAYYIPVNFHKNEVQDYGFLFNITASY